ncbi:hypothetical protein ABZY06_30275 [Streptomyces sp. NPDC006540]|jgi:hypothetical protein|uniref:hypothetical protein n=1 Tax=Streptomyces sp. NPDC006540 TaxID=3155353 RepID=UPI0033B99BFD
MLFDFNVVANSIGTGGRGRGVAFVFDGASANSRLILGLNNFVASGGGMPDGGATGGGAVMDPDGRQFLGTVTWEIT